MNIRDHAAIVSGGASGLGAATAARLARAGARVAIFDLDPDRGQQFAKEIGASFHSVDVRDEQAVAAAIETAEEQNGKARILVNCAGVATPGKILDREGNPLPLQAFANVIAVNLTGTFNMMSKFAARLVNSAPAGEERGVVVNTASVAASEGQIGQAAYSASKAGIAGMCLPAARELARYQVRVVTVAPGIFMTPMLESLPEETQAALGKQVPFPSRLGRPDEFSQLVEAIVANPMLNGETIRLDGAIRMMPR